MLEEELKVTLSVEVHNLLGKISVLETTLKYLRHRLDKKQYTLINELGELQSTGTMLDCACARVATYGRVLETLESKKESESKTNGSTIGLPEHDQDIPF